METGTSWSNEWKKAQNEKMNSVAFEEISQVDTSRGLFSNLQCNNNNTNKNINIGINNIKNNNTTIILATASSYVTSFH